MLNELWKKLKRQIERFLGASKELVRNDLESLLECKNIPEEIREDMYITIKGWRCSHNFVVEEFADRYYLWIMARIADKRGKFRYRAVDYTYSKYTHEREPSSHRLQELPT